MANQNIFAINNEHQYSLIDFLQRMAKALSILNSKRISVICSQWMYKN